MRILVTGGTGFTGSHLTRRLLAAGHEVRVVDNQKGIFYEELSGLGAEITIGSVADAALMDKLVEGCDGVQHAAAAFRKVNLPQSVYYDVNVNGTRYLLEAALKHGVQKFVYCSTCGVHGDVKNPPAAEDAPIEPEDYYQLTKYQGEEVVHEYLAKGLDACIIRPTAIYGPGDPERFLMLFRRVKTGRFYMFGPGTAHYHPVYIDNLVDAMVLAMETPASRGQTYLIADETSYPIARLVMEIGKVLNKNVSIIHLPFWPLWTAAFICESIYRFLPTEPPLFRRRADWFRQYRSFDISKARRELGYAPRVGLKEGLKMTAEWYLANGYL
ncbi:MAG: NAD(P)-dependent oxidoreductase [Acidobacteria bacterium]|nr:NAD(P)-dependent oxidoreductase [Acidobacteriota bacterium]